MTYSKYKAKKTIVNGITFSSKKEAKRFSELRLLELAKKITHLELQKKFNFELNDTKICSYVCDFAYYEQPRGNFVVEDVKGLKKGSAWAMFRVKAKLMKAFYGINIKVI